MQVQVLPFGILKDALGVPALSLELPEGATVATLLRSLASVCPQPLLAEIAVGVNAEFATAETVLKAGDEVALLPPVSGGSVGAASGTVTYLTREAIDTQALAAAARHAEDGAVIVFDGVVRNHTRGRRTLFLDYEAYEPMAEAQMAALACAAVERFGVRHVTVVHRLGRLEIGETSVLIVVASAHRAAAYEASRWLIDTLKQQVPIWKRETFADGAVWAAGEPFPAALRVDGGAEDDHAS